MCSNQRSHFLKLTQNCPSSTFVPSLLFVTAKQSNQVHHPLSSYQVFGPESREIAWVERYERKYRVG